MYIASRNLIAWVPLFSGLVLLLRLVSPGTIQILRIENGSVPAPHGSQRNNRECKFPCLGKAANDIDEPF